MMSVSFDDDLEELLVLDPRIPSLIEVHLRVLEPVEEAIQRANFFADHLLQSRRDVHVPCADGDVHEKPPWIGCATDRTPPVHVAPDERRRARVTTEP